jgi:predicted nuclease of predicted toxin-antitoxin system
VRFLVDNNLSPVLAGILRAAGHDVSRVRGVGLQAAADQVVLAAAKAEQRVVISAGTDFGTRLSRSGAKLPSVLLIRRLVGRRAAEQAATILGKPSGGRRRPRGRGDCRPDRRVGPHPPPPNAGLDEACQVAELSHS